MYKCGWNGCEKAYGTLNHLNAHVTMQSHGAKRSPDGLYSLFILLSLCLIEVTLFFLAVSLLSTPLHPLACVTEGWVAARSLHLGGVCSSV